MITVVKSNALDYVLSQNGEKALRQEASHRFGITEETSTSNLLRKFSKSEVEDIVVHFLAKENGIEEDEISTRHY